MRVRVTREYLWAPDGIHVRTVAVGEVLEGEGAEIALQMKSAEIIGEPQAEKSVEAAPENKAHHKAPKNKAR